ncbi:hypothetical protein ACJX0J_037793, partial [Zea mays]
KLFEIKTFNLLLGSKKYIAGPWLQRRWTLYRPILLELHPQHLTLPFHCFFAKLSFIIYIKTLAIVVFFFLTMLYLF